MFLNLVFHIELPHGCESPDFRIDFFNELGEPLRSEQSGPFTVDRLTGSTRSACLIDGDFKVRLPRASSYLIEILPGGSKYGPVSYDQLRLDNWKWRVPCLDGESIC